MERYAHIHSAPTDPEERFLDADKKDLGVTE
jgi:hypothetical protein